MNPLTKKNVALWLLVFTTIFGWIFVSGSFPVTTIESSKSRYIDTTSTDITNLNEIFELRGPWISGESGAPVYFPDLWRKTSVREMITPGHQARSYYATILVNKGIEKPVLVFENIYSGMELYVDGVLIARAGGSIQGNSASGEKSTRNFKIGLEGLLSENRKVDIKLVVASKGSWLGGVHGNVFLAEEGRYEERIRSQDRVNTYLIAMVIFFICGILASSAGRVITKSLISILLIGLVALLLIVINSNIVFDVFNLPLAQWMDEKGHFAFLGILPAIVLFGTDNLIVNSIARRFFITSSFLMTAMLLISPGTEFISIALFLSTAFSFLFLIIMLQILFRNPGKTEWRNFEHIAACIIFAVVFIDATGFAFLTITPPLSKFGLILSMGIYFLSTVKKDHEKTDRAVIVSRTSLVEDLPFGVLNKDEETGLWEANKFYNDFFSIDEEKKGSGDINKDVTSSTDIIKLDYISNGHEEGFIESKEKSLFFYRTYKSSDHITGTVLIPVDAISMHLKAYASIINNQSRGAAVTDSHGVVTKVNANLSKLIDECGINFDVREYMLPSLIGTITKREYEDLELPGRVIEAVNGRFFRILETLDSGEDVGITSFEDVTEYIKDRQERLEKETKDARLETIKSGMITSVAHDIQSPLVHIRTALEKAITISEEADAKEFFDPAINSVTYLMSLAREMMEYGKFDDQQITVFEQMTCIRPTLEHHIEIHKPRLEENNNKIILEVRSYVPSFVYIDRLKFGQVFNNIVSNAAKYTKNGFIKVIVEWDSSNSKIMVEVTDTGPGISKEEQRNVFKPLYRSQKTLDTEGSGFGLATVEQLTRVMNGTIDLVSTPGKGATFKFEIPVYGSSFKEDCCKTRAEIIALDDKRSPEIEAIAEYLKYYGYTPIYQSREEFDDFGEISGIKRGVFCCDNGIYVKHMDGQKSELIFPSEITITDSSLRQYFIKDNETEGLNGDVERPDISGTNVLFIEDSIEMRESIKSWMADEGVTCQFAKSLDQAKEITKINSFDVIVTDYFLGNDITALDVLRNWPLDNIIVFTGNNDHTAEVNARKKGAAAWVLKSSDKRHIISAIDNARRGNRWQESEIPLFSLKDNISAFVKHFANQSQTDKEKFIVEKDSELQKLFDLDQEELEKEAHRLKSSFLITGFNIASEHTARLQFLASVKRSTKEDIERVRGAFEKTAFSFVHGENNNNCE